MARPPRPRYPIEMLVAAKRAGYTHGDIARLLGMSKSTVTKQLAKVGEGSTNLPSLDLSDWFKTIHDWAIEVARYAEEQQRKFDGCGP